MRNSKYFKVILSVVLLAFILQIGITAYSMIYNQEGGNQGNIVQRIFSSKLFAANTEQASTEEDTAGAQATGESPATAPLPTAPAAAAGATQTAGAAKPTGTAAAVPAAAVTIPDDVLALIRAQDPAAYEKNVANYKGFLSGLNVHEQYQNEIENRIKEGKQLSYILIAYTFVSDSYGTMDEVKSLVDARTSGKTWQALFEEYRKNNPDFTPNSFDSAYLEKLLNTDGITKDDVMIADRISQKLTIPFKEVMQKRLEMPAWKEINAGYGIVNGQSQLPSVAVSPDKVRSLAQSSGLTEQRVLQAYVMAYKLEVKVETVIEKIRSGYSKERIYAECLKGKYE
jgi:hypothetical protein